MVPYFTLFVCINRTYGICTITIYITVDVSNVNCNSLFEDHCVVYYI